MRCAQPLPKTVPPGCKTAAPAILGPVNGPSERSYQARRLTGGLRWPASGGVPSRGLVSRIGLSISKNGLVWARTAQIVETGAWGPLTSLIILGAGSGRVQ